MGKCMEMTNQKRVAMPIVIKIVFGLLKVFMIKRAELDTAQLAQAKTIIVRWGTDEVCKI